MVHQATAEHMDFQAKNFSYVTKTFGEFIDQAGKGEKLYLRSLSSTKPSEIPADITTDFASIAADFQLPPALRLVVENMHSSPLRISGPVIMWLHYDVGTSRQCYSSTNYNHPGHGKYSLPNSKLEAAVPVPAIRCTAFWF